VYLFGLYIYIFLFFSAALLLSNKAEIQTNKTQRSVICFNTMDWTIRDSSPVANNNYNCRLLGTLQLRHNTGPRNTVLLYVSMNYETFKTADVCCERDSCNNIKLTCLI
jgi:hypothetical protein